MSPSPGDLLSAAGLLLGVVSVLFGLWFSEISEAMNRKVKVQPADREADYKHCVRLFYSRALPLAVESVVFALIFLPTAAATVVNAFSVVGDAQTSAPRRYDPVSASLLAVTIALITLAMYTVAIAVRLRRQCARQNPKTVTPAASG